MAETKLAKRAKSLEGTVSRMRRKQRENAAQFMMVGEAVAGAAGAGAIDAYFDNPEVLGVDATAVASGVGVLVGLSADFPGARDMAMICLGGLCGKVYGYSRDAVEEID